MGLRKHEGYKEFIHGNEETKSGIDHHPKKGNRVVTKVDDVTDSAYEAHEVNDEEVKKGNVLKRRGRPPKVLNDAALGH